MSAVCTRTHPSLVVCVECIGLHFVVIQVEALGRGLLRELPQLPLPEGLAQGRQLGVCGTTCEVWGGEDTVLPLGESDTGNLESHIAG